MATISSPLLIFLEISEDLLMIVLGIPESWAQNDPNELVADVDSTSL